MRSLWMMPVLCSTLLQAGEPVAMIVDLTGKATRQDGMACRITETLVSGEQVILPGGAKLVLMDLVTGDERTFQGPGKLRFNAQGQAEGLVPQTSSKAPLLKGKVRLRPAAMAQASVVMREATGPTAAGETRLRMLPEGPVLRSAKPDLHWSWPDVGATFLVRITDGKGRLLAELTLNDPGLSLPEHLALKPGDELTWSVETQDARGQRVVGQRRLRLVTPEEAELLDQHRPGPTAPFAARLVYASLLEQLGLRDESRGQWQALAAERPGEPVLAALGQKD